MIKERTGCVIVIIFEVFLAMMLAIIPYAVYIALKAPANADINDNYLLKAVSDMMNESSLIFINIITAIICSFLKMMGADVHIYNSMNAMEGFSLELIIICIAGILLMICITKLKLLLFSYIIRGFKGGLKGVLINSIDASVTIAGFLLCNILADMILKSQAPIFWGCAVCFLCVIYILAQKSMSRNSFVGESGFFASVSLPVEIVCGVQKSVAATLILFYILYMGTTAPKYSSLSSAIVFAIASYGGLYMTIVSISDDEHIIKRALYFVGALALFVVLSMF